LSFDLMVFDASVAPRSRQTFRQWFEKQTEWQESHGYNDPEIPAPALKSWFRDIIESFPPMNGPLASDDPDNSRVTDYSLGHAVIYGAFAWSEAEPARALAKELAAKHGVGFFDLSAEGDIWFPASPGKLERLWA
jgi:hypothetical protein